MPFLGGSKLPPGMKSGQRGSDRDTKNLGSRPELSELLRWQRLPFFCP